MIAEMQSKKSDPFGVKSQKNDSAPDYAKKTRAGKAAAATKPARGRGRGAGRGRGKTNATHEDMNIEDENKFEKAKNDYNKTITSQEIREQKEYMEEVQKELEQRNSQQEVKRVAYDIAARLEGDFLKVISSFLYSYIMILC
jgi:hypothetical protein